MSSCSSQLLNSFYFYLIYSEHLWQTFVTNNMWQTYVTNICDKHMWQTFVMNKWIKDLRNGKYIYRSVHRQSRDSLYNNDVSCVWMWRNINIYWHCMTVGVQLHSLMMTWVHCWKYDERIINITGCLFWFLNWPKFDLICFVLMLIYEWLTYVSYYLVLLLCNYKETSNFRIGDSTHSDWLCWVAGSVVTQLADIISSYDQMRTKK